MTVQQLDSATVDRETKLARNVGARAAANTIVELGITVGQDEGFEPEQVRRMWQCVMEIAATLIGDKVVEPDPPDRVQQTLNNFTRSMDDEPFPFGKYGPKEQGLTYGEVPDRYYKWLSKQDWIEHWPDVLDYIHRRTTWIEEAIEC